MNKKIISILLLSVLVLVWNLTVNYVDHELQKNRHASVYSSCHKVWAARGLYNDHSEQNSIVSMQRAFTAGALGVEVDFYYDIKMDRFIISHNKPVKGGDGNLIYTKKNGKLLTMEMLLEMVGEGHYFWFDYKNLDKLSIQETKMAIARLLSITQSSTILGIHPLRESNLFSSIAVNGYKIAYYFTNISGVALSYGAIGDPIYGEETVKSLSAIPLFLFHVPDDKDLLHKLIELDDVRVLLVGRDMSINRFNINKCK